MSDRAEKIRRTRQVVQECGAEIRQRYEAGESLADLAAAYGMSETTVASTIRRNGGDTRSRNSGIRRGKQVVKDHASEMRLRYEAGEFLRDLAEEFGVAQSTIAAAIRREGGTVRKRGYGSAPHLFRGVRNPGWRGGSYIKDGYRLIRLDPAHPFYEAMARRGYVPEHRLVMAGMVKRPLLSTETVHHIDGDRLNNDPSNLQLRLGQHGNGQHYRCADCGSQNIQASPL